MNEEVEEYIEDYKIIEDATSKGLRKKVLDQLEKDFEPQGGVSVVVDNNSESGFKYFQAMVLVVEEGEE